VNHEGRACALALLVAGAGLTHFVVPHVYDAIVPRALPGPARAWTIGSGVVELTCAAAVANRPTRRAGALATLLLFVLVFPANVQMALDWQDDGMLRRIGSLVRLPLQAPLIMWAWRVARDDADMDFTRARRDSDPQPSDP
jgi:uncharacterized membrane protein